MGGISVSGIGSGLDLNGLVTQLIAAEGEPAQRRLDSREAVLQARISAYGSLKSALSSFRSSLSNANNAASFQSFSATSSDSASVTASAVGSATPATYNVEVQALAESQKLASGAFEDRLTVVGQGELNFRFGTYDSGGNTFTGKTGSSITTVTIDSTNNTLAGVADAVNAADFGVRASIIDDGSGQRLVFSVDDTGATNSLEIIVTNDGDADNLDNAGLSQLAFDPTAAGVGTGRNLTETAAASDARITIDGLTVTRPSNTFGGALEGVTLQANAISTGPAAVSVDRDLGAASSAVSNFVAGYNSLVSTFDDLAGFDADTGDAGLLIGDTLLRSVENRVRAAATSVPQGLENASFRALADVGITTGEDGTLNLDNAKLQTALDADPDAVARLFAEVGTVTDSAATFVTYGANTLPGTYDVEVTTLATRGQYVGTTLSSLVVDGTNNTLSLAVDGAQTATLSLTQTTYASGADLAAEIQARANADTAFIDAGVTVTVTFDTDHLVLTSTRYGDESSVSITSTGATSPTTLGIGTAVGTSTAGVDVAGSIGGAVATGDGQRLTANGAAAGLAIDILGGNLGARGSTTFAQGIAFGLGGVAASFLDGDNLIDTSLEGLEDRVESLGVERERLSARLAAREELLRAQFTALDILLARLSQTSNFLAQQLGGIPGNSNNANS